MHDEDNDMDLETVTITDDAGRTLVCSIEHSLELEGEEYVVLMPVDTPVEIVYWLEDDDEQAIPVDDDSQIDLIFPIAKVVLEEQNLVLKRTALTLTVEGELPDLEEEEEIENGAMEEVEELQFLASFYHEEQEFGVYAPLDEFLILARMDANHQPKLLSKEELEKIEPMLPMIEDQLLKSFNE
jgi:hypothetical protein